MTRAVKLLAALPLLLLLASEARAQVRSNYVNFHGELASRSPGAEFMVPSGLYVEWGVMQSQYVATGTRLGVTRADPSLGTALFFGGGPQFHFRIEEELLVLPSLNIGYRISEAGMGLAGLAGVAFAYVHDRYYFGLEAETLAFGQGARGWSLFPGTLSVNGLFGFYY
jgi:hypothetical protein